MASVATIRTGHVNHLLHRQDADTRPWTNAEIDAYTGAVLRELWPTVGVYATGDVASDPASNEYTIPAGIERITIIDILDGQQRYVDRVSNWRPIPAGKAVIKPLMGIGSTLRFTGYKPYAADGVDLPTRLEQVVAFRVAGRAWDGLGGELLNSQRQQNLDSGRVVTYSDAVGMAAYYEQRYQEVITRDPSLVRSGPRAARR